jgi:hypothetical protein
MMQTSMPLLLKPYIIKPLMMSGKIMKLSMPLLEMPMGNWMINRIQEIQELVI